MNLPPSPAEKPAAPGKRLPIILVPERLKDFALRLKTNARWMKRFLHGDH